MKKLDSIDQKMISALLNGGPMSAKALASSLGMHPNTALQRLKKLENGKVLNGYKPNVDFEKLGFGIHIAIMMKVKRGRPGDISQFKEILQMKELESFYAISGPWDIVSTWRVQDKDHLNRVLSKITGHQNITKTMSQLILYTYKDVSGFNPLG